MLAQINPLYHVVELVRHAVFGWGDALDRALALGVLIGFGLLMWRTAIRAMQRKLVD